LGYSDAGGWLRAYADAAIFWQILTLSLVLSRPYITSIARHRWSRVGSFSAFQARVVLFVIFGMICRPFDLVSLPVEDGSVTLSNLFLNGALEAH
jgi:hypothetical protein